jgi:transcriptional regulator with XRE-family HTH domain
MNIGRKILELRKQINITQEELASELGVTAAAVSKWENNYTLPDILMLGALADFFNVTTDELLDRNRQTQYAVIVANEIPLGQKI